MSRPYFYALGKRKSAIARVRLFQEGTGTVTINDEKVNDYFFSIFPENALAPLAITDRLKTIDIEASIEGGGKSAQSDALRLGISRALVLMDPSLRTTLKQQGFLRRDSRIKERKKPGLHRARRAPQFAKR